MVCNIKHILWGIGIVLAGIGIVAMIMTLRRNFIKTMEEEEIEENE
jgi:beta-lactamase regulating signal transducer with metallopeptidase domain